MAVRGEFKDYYLILGIPFSASAIEIRLAYRRLAMRYHPDLVGSNLFEKQMKLVNKAYSVLSNPEKRRRYDLTYRFYKGKFRQPPVSDTYHPVVYSRSSPDAKHTQDWYRASAPSPPSNQYWKPPSGGTKPASSYGNPVHRGGAPGVLPGIITSVFISAIGAIFNGAWNGSTFLADSYLILALIALIWFTAAEVYFWIRSRKQKPA